MSIHRLCAKLILGAIASAALCRPVMAMTIASGGKAKCVILVAKDAIAPEVTAGKELQKYLGQITGAKFEITSDAKARPGYSRILLGQSAAVKKALPKLDWRSLRYDGIVIKTVGNDLVLTGDRPRGTLYAVYTFLEDNLGCQWWTATEEYVPSKPSLKIGAINTRYVPKLRCREAHSWNTYETSEFSAKLKVNGVMQETSAEYGGHYKILGGGHSFQFLIPPDKYGQTHPEWFSLLNGKREPSPWTQLCLTNDEMRKELTKNALQWCKEEPEAGMVSVSENDAYGFCECPDCTAAVKKLGSQTDVLIDFVNKVAADIQREYPDMVVETLAYQWSQSPPVTVKPSKNVMIRLCLIRADVTEPINSEANKIFRDDVLSWSKMAHILYVWNYNANFSNYILPHPNIQNYAENLRFFVANKTIGMFEQGDLYCSVGDFCRLRAWLDSHLLWNQDLDQKKLEQEFLKGYYGAAAPHLSDYLDLTVASVQRWGQPLTCYHGTDDFFTLDDLNQANQLFDKAEAAVASDPVLLNRVQRERMPLELVWLMRGPAMLEQARKDNATYLGPTDYAVATDQFLAKAKLYNVTHWAEWNPFVNLENYLKSLVKPAP